MIVDLTGVAASAVAGVIAVLGTVLTVVINNRMADKQAAATLNNAVQNSLGKLAQSTTALIDAAKPSVTIPDVPANLQAPVQYVLDHAGAEASRFGVTPAAIADKIDAQIGLAKIAKGASIDLTPKGV